jgi:hypothetical protein
MPKLDLDKLRDTIDNKKQELNTRKGALGESTIIPVTGDQFLRELVHTRQTGQETGASIKVKAVNDVAEAKLAGKTVDPSILEHITSSSSTQSIQQPAEVNGHIPTATEVAKMSEAKRIREQSENNYNQTLAQPASTVGVADAISQYQQMGRVGTPMGNQGMLTEQQVIANQMAAGAPPQLIIEQVNNVATQLLNENFGHLFAEAMKNSIIESYKAEVIKEALEENKSVIEKIVRDTIIDLQRINKSKK